MALVGLAPTAASAATQVTDVTVTLRITIGVGDPSWPADSDVIGVPSSSSGSGRGWECRQGFTTGVPKDVTVTVPEGTFLPIWSSHACYDSLTNGTADATTDGEVIEVDVP
ncbi:hypothetical protein E0500_042800 [Streptomyces sp. KM273126]|uniref:hypothetical protein n=1 Tax=Streptomyces sp. KM273126 TaxID=2545247 RepID=UPI001038A5AB|nr:hypothetical protein [Streptomyces sp. KM273126]MBA2813864.1 hypothetical protein [Streptomyces sp. KM273126]